MDYKKIAILAAVTFVEAAAAYYVVALGANRPTDKVLIAGAIGAGISAAYNVVKQLIVKK